MDHTTLLVDLQQIFVRCALLNHLGRYRTKLKTFILVPGIYAPLFKVFLGVKFLKL